MKLPNFTDGEIILTYLLAAFIDRGGTAQFSSDTLAHAAYMVASRRVPLVPEDLPDGGIAIRLMP